MRKLLTLFFLVCPFSLSFAEDVSPSQEPVIQPTPSLVPITREEKARIYSEFKKKLTEEEREFEKQEKIERRDLVRMQNERRKDWREKERKARRDFFEAHTSGPDRRHYVQDFVKRKKEFDATEKKEWVEFKQKQNEDHKAFRISRQERSRRVNESLDRNLKPEL